MCKCIKDEFPEAIFVEMPEEIEAGVYQISKKFDEDYLYPAWLPFNYCPKCGEKIERRQFKYGKS